MSGKCIFLIVLIFLSQYVYSKFNIIQKSGEMLRKLRFCDRVFIYKHHLITDLVDLVNLGFDIGSYVLELLNHKI